MKRLEYVRFCIPEGKETPARKLLADMGFKPPTDFDNEASDFLATSHSVVTSEDQAKELVAKLIDCGIDDNPFTRSERKFTPKEMTSAALFWMHVQKQKGDGYTVHDGSYDASAACQSCGSGIRQAGELVIECADFKGVHLAATHNFEIVVSVALCQKLARLNGASFTHVVDCRTGTVSLQFRQLMPTAVLPDLVPPTRFKRSSKYCRACGQNGVYLDSEMHLENLPNPDTDFYRTRQLFGEMRERACPGPELAFSWRALEVIREFDKRAVKQEPVYVRGELLCRG